jgi:hypothetical protein
MANSKWDLRVIEVVKCKIKPLKLKKVEKAGVRVDRTIETAATKISQGPSHEQHSLCSASGVHDATLGYAKGSKEA